MTVPVSPTIQSKIAQATHLGLLLDKYADSWHPGLEQTKFSERVQKPTLEGVVTASRAAPTGLDWQDLTKRRAFALNALGAVTVRATTAGPLTMHLARASALENAGLCLHRVYGFAYLPGSGIKGLARAYAKTSGAADADIQCVFGNEPGEPNQKKQRAGAIVFHDAWPATWPRLVHDIVNSHHGDYYGASPTDNQKAPGDWEEPNMVSFLAVPAGVEFGFPLSKRRDDVPDRVLDLAREWLVGALTTLGAGAKTAAGYGHFTVDGKSVPATSARFEATLELVTPAFLAGADPANPEGCDLRPATLRGLLRWWWRTLHAGFVDVATLRRMEAAVWGDTRAGGAVRVTVERVGKVTPLRYDRPFVIAKNNLPKPPNNKTTQGLTYHSFGMDEKDKKRFVITAGTKWQLKMTARESTFVRLDRNGKALPGEQKLAASVVLAQAKAALWLLSQFGGVGSKSRKGFGAFSLDPMPEFADLAACEAEAAAFRSRCGLGTTPFQEQHALSPASAQRLAVFEMDTPWKNVWLALDQVGDVAQRFAQARKHDNEKKALGLPRRIGHPTRGTFSKGPDVKKDRHAAPVHYHVARLPDGRYQVRILCLPACQLPNLAASRKMLQALLEHFQAELPKRCENMSGPGTMPPVYPPAAGGPGAGGGIQAMLPGKPKPKDKVEVEIVDDPKGKGRLFAKHLASGLVGIVNPTERVPAEQRAIGTRLTLEVATMSADGKQISFRGIGGA